MSGTEERVQRRLAAILAADVAGYSRQMGADEVGTLAALKAVRREIVDAAIAAHNGRIFKTTGDGMLVEFASAVDATQCAIEIQRGAAVRNTSVQQLQRIEFRIGIHVGDIIVDEDDIFGDGVNIAARLEGIADPGGVCISDDAQRQIRRKVDISFEDMGPQQLKNIAEPMRAWRLVTNASGCTTAPIEAPVESTQALAFPDKPSIAVLPFQNMSGDPDQEYFADGMVEEITTALSRFQWLFVIARTSTFAYKGRSIDVKQVSRELGVRYLLEGSVRRSGNRVRITGQLIDASTGAHLWADRFEGSLENIFELQDHVASGVVGAIDPKLLAAEMARVRCKAPADLNAYDRFLRASDQIYRWTIESHEEALRLLYQAIELDPNFAAAYGLAAHCYCFRKSHGPWDISHEFSIAETGRLARRAVELGKDDALALCCAGYALAYVVRELDDGAAFIDQALALNSNLARAWNLSGWVRIWLGDPETAITHLARAMRLSPLDPAVHAVQAATASAHFFAGRYDEASSWAVRALREQPNNLDVIGLLAMSDALAGRLEKARIGMTRLVQLSPGRSLSNISDRMPPYRRPEDRAKVVEAARKAGLPE
jgi:TolB-like protein/class 3 adenylate cyclase/Tfp pilus assembly protein PilF